jgi:RarD protein
MGARQKIIAAMLIWGSMGLLVRNIPLPSGEIALVRGGIGVFFLVTVSFLMKTPLARRELIHNQPVLLASGIALGVNWILLFEAYQHTTIANATLSYYLAPVIITVLSRLVLKEKLTVIKGICILAALTGLALVAGVFTAAPPTAGHNLGILYGVAAAVAYAGFTLLNKFLKGLTSLAATIAQLGVATIVLLPYTLFAGNATAVIAGRTVLLLIILGIIHTGLAFWLFFSAVKDLKAQTVAVFSYIDPVTAIILSACLLDEKMGPVQILGACLILGSTLLSEICGSFNLRIVAHKPVKTV